MKTKHFALIITMTALGLLALSGCGSTTVENGVTIQKKANYNLLDYIPFLGE